MRERRHGCEGLAARVASTILLVVVVACSSGNGSSSPAGTVPHSATAAFLSDMRAGAEGSLLKTAPDANLLALGQGMCQQLANGTTLAAMQGKLAADVKPGVFTSADAALTLRTVMADLCPAASVTPDPEEAPDPAAVGAAAPAAAATVPAATGAACRTGDPLANVYHPSRLRVIRPCVTVAGVIVAVRHEADGDAHVNVDLDPQYRGLVNDRNVSGEGGALVVEIVPADEPGCSPGKPPKPASGTYDYGICTGAALVPPAVGARVEVTGPYVLDDAHGWMEIHPAWAIGAPAASAATIAPSTGPQPTSPPSTAGQAAGSCTASVDNPSPTRNQTVTVSVASNVSSASFTATAHYKSKDTVQSGATNSSGSGSVAFRISSATPGYSVRVDVDISGRASCSTQFTPQ